MRYSFIFVALILSVAFCTEEKVDEYTQLYKYREACPGYVNNTETTFGKFVSNTLSKEAGSLLSTCQTDFFKTIPDECDSNHIDCVVCFEF